MVAVDLQNNPIAGEAQATTNLTLYPPSPRLFAWTSQPDYQFVTLLAVRLLPLTWPGLI